MLAESRGEKPLVVQNTVLGRQKGVPCSVVLREDSLPKEGERLSCVISLVRVMQRGRTTERTCSSTGQMSVAVQYTSVATCGLVLVACRRATQHIIVCGGGFC